MAGGGFDLKYCYSSKDISDPSFVADGACHKEIEWAAESDSAIVVGQNLLDPSFAVGRAFLLLQCYNAAPGCHDICFPESDGGP